MARVGLVDCPCCGGSGEVCIGAEVVYEPGCGFWHTEPLIRPCPDCEGTGQIMADDEMADDEESDDFRNAPWGENSQFGVGA